MFSILCSILSSVLSYIILSRISFPFNAQFYLLLVEITKLLVAACCMCCIKKQKIKFRWGFIVNALLYAAVNSLTYFILSSTQPSVYSVLNQHKIIWVVIFSLILLKKTFSKQQYIALAMVCSGCILVKMSDAGVHVSVFSVCLIIVQGICSSLSSVWIEKMMKVTDRPHVSDNIQHQKLYWYLADSVQMYCFGIPIYACAAIMNKNTIVIPDYYALLILVVGTVQGLSLGAVFVYHSSVVRSLISAVVIVILAVYQNEYSLKVVTGIVLVVTGVVCWVWRN